MTSKDRKEIRYQRRRSAREAKRLEMLKTYNFDRVASPDALFQSAKDARRGVYWKASVQRYCMSLLRNSFKTSSALQSGEDVRRGFIPFDIIERGKLRHIQSVHFSERVVQRSLCSNALVPLLTRSLIYDNGASIANKGIDFALRRLKKHLHDHYKKHGNAGYIVLVDFKGYFDNIHHVPLYDLYARVFGEDKQLVALASLFVDAFGEMGLGLGSETSQINAITYPNSIDHYIKEVLRCKSYGRYMDDSHIICETKQQAVELLDTLLVKYAEKGIIVNRKRTAIVKLSHGFTFLKTHFSLTKTGCIVCRPCRQSIVRQRRKLKKFKRFLDAGQMTMEHIRTSYMSWRGFIAHKNARRTIQAMDALYHQLFGIWPITKQKTRRVLP